MKLASLPMTLIYKLPRTPSHLDELAGFHTLLEGGAELVGEEVEGRVGGSDVLLDGLHARAVALLQSLDGLQRHLPRKGQEEDKGMISKGSGPRAADARPLRSRKE